MTPNEEFESRCGAVIDRLANHFALESDEAVTPALERLRTNLAEQYAAAFPSASAAGLAAIVDHLIVGIRSRRAEIEARGENPDHSTQ
jgi:hypothetical protein